MLKIVELVADMLAQSGVDMVFGLPGGSTPFLFEELYKRSNQFKTVLTRHEAAATVMADVYARITRKPGIVIGQGVWMATNGGFGLAEAYLAGSPVVLITEFSDWYGLNQQAPYQVGTGEYGAIDLLNIYKSFSKYTTQANTPGELLYGIQLALKHATTGRPGPAVVISKWNVMMGVLKETDTIEPPSYPLSGYLKVSPPCISSTDAKTIADLLLQASRPVMICGRGIHTSQAYQEVQELAELIGLPVTTSYMGKGSIAETHPLALGSMAALGQKLANERIKQADVILVVGSCLSPENTNNCKKDFIDPTRQQIIQIDIEARNAGWTFPVFLGITSDAKLALQAIISQLKQSNNKIDVQQRIHEIQAAKNLPAMEWFTSKFAISDELPLAPERVVKAINKLMREDDLLILDGGNNRMWFTKLFQTKKAGQLIGPGGAAGMSWAASAAIGAAFVYNRGKVIAAIGDGGLLMALYNFETIKQYKLPLILVVFNNSCLGNVRDFLTRKGQTVCEYDEINFANIAQIMGLKGVRVDTVEQLQIAFQEALNSEAAVIIDVVVKPASHIRIRGN